MTDPLGPRESLDDDVVLRVGDLRSLQRDFSQFMLRHRFAMDEVLTKLNILRDEFAMLHDRNPIEHVSSRLKSPESIVEKMQRKGTEMSFDAIRKSITDIAGIRVTCSFVSDVHEVWALLERQRDITVLDVRDYITEPKSNGYRSLHALIEVPVFLSDGPTPVTVEVQFRTIAMDFWASLEHKIHYKYRGAVPDDLADRLRSAAESAHVLDSDMEDLHHEVRGLASDHDTFADPQVTPSEDVLSRLQRLAGRETSREVPR